MNKHIAMAKAKPAVVLNLDVVGNIDPHNYRTFVLNAPSYAIRVGRGSKNGDRQLYPSPNNAWFESRVMSREHAVIKADLDLKSLFVEDIGSMHGTFINERRVSTGKRELLVSGDTIRFGAEVSRGPETFPSLRVIVRYNWYNGPHEANLAKGIESVFEISDDEESDIEIIQEYKRQPGPAASRTFAVPESDISAAGSFISDDDLSEEERDNYLPSSARTMMKGFSSPQGPEVGAKDRDKSISLSEDAPNEVSVTSEAQAVPNQSDKSDVKKDGENDSKNDPKDGTSKASEISLLIGDGNVTQSDSESDYSDRPPFISDSIDSDADSEQYDDYDVDTGSEAGTHSSELDEVDSEKDVQDDKDKKHWSEQSAVYSPPPATETFASVWSHGLGSSQESGQPESSRSVRPPSPSDAAMPKATPCQDWQHGTCNHSRKPFDNPFPQVANPWVFGQPKEDSFYNSQYSNSHFSNTDPRADHDYTSPNLCSYNPSLQVYPPVNQASDFFDSYQTTIPTIPWSSINDYEPEQQAPPPRSTKTRVTIAEIVEKQVPESPKPGPSTLKRKVDDIADIVELETSLPDAQVVEALSPTQASDVVETITVVSEEPPKKRAKTSTSPSKAGKYAKYAGFTVAGAVTGAVFVIGGLLALPTDVFL